MMARRKNIFGWSAKEKAREAEHVRRYRAAGERASAATSYLAQQRDKRSIREAKALAAKERKEEARLRKQEADDARRIKRLDAKDKKLAAALERKYADAAAKAAKVSAKRVVSDKGILAELMRENPDLAAWRKRNPAKFDRCVKEVQAKGGTANAYAVCTAAGTRRKKNPAAESAAAFEEFHGYPSDELVTVSKKVHVHKHLAAAGELRKMEVWGVDDKGHKITGFKGALLCFNEAKNQLFVEGGDQSINLKDFGISHPHELETLGQLVSIDYFTRKDHLGDEGGTAVYKHRLRTTNENGKHVVVDIARYPDLIYRVLDEQFEFSGGSYVIRAEGIDK